MKTIPPAIAEHALSRVSELEAENEKLRGLLEAALYYVPSNKTELRALIDAALSQQAEPTDTYTAVDMATAAAQGFRDGQAAVEPAEAEWVDFGFDDRSVKVSQEAYSIFLDRERHHLAALSAVTAERDRLREDAERYRWLTEEAWFQQAMDRFDIDDGGLLNRFQSECAKIIDAAMAAKEA